jgi:biopolymer transport protein ExbB
MYPISLLAILSLLVGIWKTIQLYMVRSHFDTKVEKIVSLIAADKIPEAQEFIQTLKSPLRKMMEEALLHRSTTRENLEELLNENILAQIPKLDRFLPVLSVSAGAAPLLGLLGTVMGIITTFEMISLYGTGDPNTMAGGISEALITTEAGLIVAIPALLWHAILNRRLKTIVGNLEKASLGFINMLFLGKGKNELD